MSTPRKLAQTTLTTNQEVLYAPEEGVGAMVTTMWLGNVTGGAITWTLYDANNDGALTKTTQLTHLQSLAAGAYIQISTQIVLDSTNTLWAKADTAGGINMTLYGLEYTL